MTDQQRGCRDQSITITCIRCNWTWHPTVLKRLGRAKRVKHGSPKTCPNCKGPWWRPMTRKRRCEALGYALVPHRVPNRFEEVRERMKAKP